MCISVVSIILLLRFFLSLSLHFDAVQILGSYTSGEHILAESKTFIYQLPDPTPRLSRRNQISLATHHQDSE